jgi:hypothetical protein
MPMFRNLLETALHIASVFALPLISLAAGVTSLYIDPIKQPKLTWIFVALMAVSAIGSVMLGYRDDKAKMNSAIIEQNDSESIKALSVKTDAMNLNINTIIAMLTAGGVSRSTTGMIAQSFSADKALADISPSLLKNEGSGNVTVTYYPKDVDGPVVINALKEGGFKVETSNGNPNNANLKTNAIWVGDSVTLEQAKFVALTLVRAGVGVVSLRKGFKIQPEAKRNLIEVGTDASLTGAQPKTVEWITALTQIPTNGTTTNDLSN